MDPVLIGNTLLAIVLFTTAMATKWSTQARAQRREIKRLRAKFEIYEAHLYDLRALLAHHGIKRPPVPAGLLADESEEDEA